MVAKQGARCKGDWEQESFAKGKSKGIVSLLSWGECTLIANRTFSQEGEAIRTCCRARGERNQRCIHAGLSASFLSEGLALQAGDRGKGLLKRGNSCAYSNP